MLYRFYKFCENRARNTLLRGVYISHFGQIWVKISVLGVLHACRCTDGVTFATEMGTEGPSFVPNFTPSVQRIAPAGRKTSKSASEQTKYRRLALRAMLPVKNKSMVCYWQQRNNVIRRSCISVCPKHVTILSHSNSDVHESILINLA